MILVEELAIKLKKITINIMNTKIKYIPTGKIYSDRKKAKKEIGHSKFNKALRDGLLFFMSTYSPTDVIV